MTVESYDSIGIATLSARDFSRALGKLPIITRDSDSLIAPFAPVVMGRSWHWSFDSHLKTRPKFRITLQLKSTMGDRLENLEARQIYNRIASKFVESPQLQLRIPVASVFS